MQLFVSLSLNNELIYIDTNCYIDYFESRTDGLRPLGDFSYNLIRKAMNCDYCIALSSLVYEEMKYLGYVKKFDELVKMLDELDKIVYVEPTEADSVKAKDLATRYHTPLNDTKHLILATRLNCSCLVTRNIKHFSRLFRLLEIRLPESL